MSPEILLKGKIMSEENELKRPISEPEPKPEEIQESAEEESGQLHWAKGRNKK